MVILCTIDLETREVSLPAGQVIASYDHNVDVIRFQAEAIPGFSLNTSSIRIAAQGPNKARHDYAVDPATVSIEEETGYITFDWPIPAGVTEMPIGSGFKYGDRGQLIFAVCAEIISGDTVSKAWHSDDGIITVVAHLEPESGGGEDPEEEATNAQKIGQLQTDVAVVQREVAAVAGGVPTVVGSVSDMVDTGLIYILSSDSNWYYYNGSAWTSGGTYGGAVTSTTFNQHGVPADDFAVGEALADKADSSDVESLAEDIAELQDGGYVADQQKIAEKINDWLEEHPEATTTVQDGSLTTDKFVTGALGYVSYEMFGAVLDGVHDDSSAVLSAHQYANSHNIPVIQRGGRLLVNFSGVPIKTDCDLALDFVITDSTPNDAYVIQHDSTEGVTATLDISAGANVVTDAILKGRFCVPYIESDALSLGRRNSGNEAHNVQFWHHQPLAVDLNGNILTMYPWMPVSGTEIQLRGYSRLDEKGVTIKGGNVIVNKTNAYGFPTLFRISRNNTKVADFTVNCPTEINSETSFGGLFAVHNCCNVLFSNINGLNHSVRASLAHSYVIDIYGAWNVRIENCNIMQGWGAMASHFSDTVCMENCTFNRWDGHYGVFGTNIIHNCNFVGLGMIRIGYGSGSVDIDGCTCSQNSADTSLSNGFVSFRNDFPVYYQGTVYIRHLRSTSTRLFNLSDYALENPGAVGTFPDETLRLICYNLNVGTTMNVFNQSAASRNIDFYAYDCPRLRFVHTTTGITLRIYNSNVARAEVGSNSMYLYGGSAGAIITSGTVWASGARIVGNVKAEDAEFFGCHALSALTITATIIKVENCGGTAQVALVGTATVHNSNKWGTGTVSGSIKVKTIAVATSNIGSASLAMLVTDATVLSVYSRTGVSGEYCRFTPYVVDTTWYVAAETSNGPVASTALDIVVYYIDKT